MVRDKGFPHAPDGHETPQEGTTNMRNTHKTLILAAVAVAAMLTPTTGWAGNPDPGAEPAAGWTAADTILNVSTVDNC